MKLTIYPNGYGFVSRDIIVQLESGLNDVEIDKIPKNIDRHSLIFSFQKTPDVEVQTYEILENSVNLLIEASESGEYLMSFFYKLNSISYNSFYNFLYDNIEEKMSIYGWVEILNESGLDFEDIELQVVVNENSDNVMFSLDGLYNIDNKKTISVSFLSKTGIDVYKKLVVPFDSDITKECIFVKNDEESQLGIPLMAGYVAFYSQDENNNLQHIGEDNVGIYLPNEDILFEIGKADDLVVVSRQVIDDAITVNLKNISDEIVDIHLEVNLFGRRILDSNSVITMDGSGMGYIDMRLTPLTTNNVVYRLSDLEPISTI